MKALLDCFNLRALLLFTVALLALLWVPSAQSQTGASITRLVARIELQKNTNVTVDEEVEVVLPTSESSVVASWSRFNYLESLKWEITRQLRSISVDGSVRNVKSEDRDDQTIVTILEPRSYAPGKHVLRIAYTASGKFTADGDYYAPPGHNYHLTTGVGLFGELPVGASRVRDLPVEAARVVLVFPADVSLSDVIVRPATRFTATEAICDCKIDSSPSEHSITIETTHGGPVIEIYFPPSSLAPDRAERRRLEDQAHPNLRALRHWGASMFLYLVLAAALAGCTAWMTAWRPYERALLWLLALCAGVVAIAVANARLDLLDIGRPGLDAGIWISMVIFPGAHGPTQEFLIVPIAMVAQVLFYYGVGRLVFFLARQLPFAVRATNRG